MKIIGLTVFILISLSSIFAQEARKIDEFGNESCDDFLTRRDSFIGELNSSPGAIGYIFVYEGKLQIIDSSKKNPQIYYVLPHVGEAREHLFGMKLRFRDRFPLDKFIFVNGGFREKFTVEFWLVLLGTKPPMPMPTLKKIRYKKGRPSAFCGEF